MSQIRMATGVDTRADSNLDRNSGIAGSNFPSAPPPAMQAATHSVKNRSKKLNPFFSAISFSPYHFLAHAPLKHRASRRPVEITGQALHEPPDLVPHPPVMAESFLLA